MALPAESWLTLAATVRGIQGCSHIQAECVLTASEGEPMSGDLRIAESLLQAMAPRYAQSQSSTSTRCSLQIGLAW